ncbi:MAG: DUF2239 family protein [Caulobacteraceae bacterium]
MTTEAGFVAFADKSRLAYGSLAAVASAARRALDRQPNANVLVFNVMTGAVVELDLRGTEPEVIGRLPAPPSEDAAKRGRPKLGVVAREVTLLPRHWEWLAQQKGGASVTLRALVEAARKADVDAQPSRARTEAAYRFMTVIAGDLPGYEEATRALFAQNRPSLEQQTSAWPEDIREETLRFAYGRD